MIFFQFFFLILFSLNAYAYQYELTVCAIFQNDAPYLKEWIEHHRKQGVQFFWLYNNESTDNFREVLKPYIKKKIVKLIEWPGIANKEVNWNTLQCNAYNDCLRHCKKKTKWCAIIDTDEFLFCPDGTLLTKALESYEKFGGVGVNWVMYGTSGVERILPHEKMVDKLIFRSALENSINLHIKTIVRPSRVINCPNPHFCLYQPNGLGAVTENKIPVEGPFTEFNSVNKFRINHYWSRDKEFFHSIKLSRQLMQGVNVDAVIQSETELNGVYDPILSHSL